MLKNVKEMTSSPEGSGKSCKPGWIYSIHMCKIEKNWTQNLIKRVDDCRITFTNNWRSWVQSARDNMAVGMHPVLDKKSVGFLSWGKSATIVTASNTQKWHQTKKCGSKRKHPTAKDTLAFTTSFRFKLSKQSVSGKKLNKKMKRPHLSGRLL